jgi:hypothetical protein
MIAPEAGLSVSRQCALLRVARSSFYYRLWPEELDLLKRLDRIFTDIRSTAAAGCRSALSWEGLSVGRPIVGSGHCFYP